MPVPRARAGPVEARGVAVLTVQIHNDGKHAKMPERGSYDFAVYVNEILLLRGRVEDHKRVHGWRTLLRKVAREAMR